MDQITEVQSYNYALKTLKERCHLLKQQLQSVDEENLKLKVQLANSKLPKNDALNQNILIEQVEVLLKQKSQLSNQIHILATENKNMWSRLSGLTIVNRNLGRRMSKISETLDNHGLHVSMNDSDVDTAIIKDTKDHRKNIEEMSQRLINNIKLEKYELEKQYAQMVALHSQDSYTTLQDFAFSSTEPDEDNVNNGIRKHANKLNSMKNRLVEQQSILISALEELKKFKSQAVVKANLNNLKDVSTETELNDSPSTANVEPTLEVVANPIEVNNSDSEQICPMCGHHIPGTSEKFADHVSGHFDAEDEHSFIRIPEDNLL